ncbi:MAG TPA: class I SAM-dependent methyltransferase [Candidatus Hydrogenedens sp.]|nr:class I SAM-dependent methyltransferase [Candidatus Hydrogenedens sp.]
MDEHEFIEYVGKTYTKGAMQDRVIRELIVRTIKPYLNPQMIGLQLGYAEGVDTAMLAPLLAELDVVEGNAAFIWEGKKKNIPNVRFISSLFEELTLEKTGRQYDVIFAIYVMEHVQDTSVVLNRIRRLLLPEGIFYAVVPNARALSRQLARHMGILEELDDFTPHDLQHGHRRIYDRVRLNRDLTHEGFKIIHQGGIFLKILADFQLNQLYRSGILGPSQIDGLYLLGLEYPDLCGSIFSIAKRDELFTSGGEA